MSGLGSQAGQLGLINLPPLLHLGTVPSSEKPGSRIPELLRGSACTLPCAGWQLRQTDRHWCEQELPVLLFLVLCGPLPYH